MEDNTSRNNNDTTKATNKIEPDESNVDHTTIDDELYEPSSFLTPNRKNNIREYNINNKHKEGIEIITDMQPDDLIPLEEEYALNKEDMENMFNNSKEEIIFKNEQQNYDLTKTSLDINDKDNCNNDNNINTDEENNKDEIEVPTQRSRKPPSKYHDFYQFYMENENANNTTIKEYDETEASFMASFMETYSKTNNSDIKCLHKHIA